MNEQPPVKIGEIYEVEINAVGGKGDGIGRVKGFVLFVPGTAKGDYVKVKITKVLPKVGFAEVVGTGEKPEGRKFETLRPEETPEKEEEAEHYEDTEDFGEEG